MTAAIAIPFPFDKASPFPINAPYSPPDFDKKVISQIPNSVQLSLPSLTKATRPTLIVPPSAPFPPVFTGSILDNFKAALAQIDLDHCDAHGENAFFVCDLAEVYRQHMRWIKELGKRVEAFFAVKCNPDPHVLHLLAALGLGFDCASQPEISSILSLPIAVDPSRIIYANPCKAPSFIRHAASNGVNYMTFDNGDELLKVKKFHPHAKMVLRILTDDSGSLCRLGLKFGAPLSEVRTLLQKAKALEITVKGVSFHCGSGCTNPALYGDAVRRARWAFEVGAEEGFDFDLLDIGGGFEDNNFELIASVVRGALEDHFPVDGAGKGIRIIAEPGRYYVSRAFELATNIIARRAARESEDDEPVEMVDNTVALVEEEKPTVMYYINDGVYGAFNCILFDHQIVQPHVLTLSETFIAEPVYGDKEMELCSVWGPTCDSIDLVQSRATLPTGLLRVGDWLRWEAMGAYTICAASQFNGFRRSEVRYTIDAKSDGSESVIRALMSTV